MHRLPASLSPTTRVWLALLLAGGGLFLVGAYAGVFNWPTVRACRLAYCDPRHWQVLSLGMGLAAAAVALLLPKRWRLLRRLNAAAVVLCLGAGVIGSYLMR